MRFTDRGIQAIKPGRKRFELWEDGRTGLGLRVSPAGRKSWLYMYRFGGKPRRMRLRRRRFWRSRFGRAALDLDKRSAGDAANSLLAVLAIDFVLAVEAVRRFGTGLQAPIFDPVVTPTAPPVLTAFDQLQRLSHLPQT